MTDEHASGSPSGQPPPRPAAGESSSGPAPPESDRWERISELFAAAVELPDEERAGFIEARCGDDASLRDEIAGMLDAHGSEGPLDRMSDAFETWTGAGDRADPDLDLGARIGPYRILRLIGEGGMGRVYLAERADGEFDQSVAIKVVRRGWASTELYERFLRERQILAGLDHPNIARLIDGGLTPRGRPFLAMEFVAGLPIHEYCEAGRLAVSQRLELFTKVCRAVQHAHQNLIVHRDLKPANILVTDDGTPKLLDFGLARLIGPADRGGEALTRTGLLRMTPEYASPEQARGGPATTATDTYALGVVLYELLTGRRPYELSGSASEMERIICTTQPEPPSQRVFERAEATAAGGSRRLQRRLSGDLDRIVLKALRKEPERRYATAGALADDVRRHLDGLPVTARPDTIRYRAGKFVRRHRVSVAAAGLVLLSLVAGIVGTATQARRATAQATEARRAAARAELVSEFLVNLFTAPDPQLALGEELSADDILARGADQLSEGGALEAEPETQANLLDVLARVYSNMGRNSEALPLVERALALRREVLPEGHLEIAGSLSTLGLLLDSQRRLDEAEVLFREALEIRLAVLGRLDDDVATAYHNLSSPLFLRGELDSARVLLTEAATIRRELGLENDDLASNLDGLAIIAGRQGDHETSISLLEEGLELRQRFLDPQHPDIANGKTNLGVALMRKGDPVAAEAPLREAVDIWRAVLGPDHPQLAAALSNLGSALLRQERMAEAETAFLESLAIRRRLYPDGGHPDLARILNSLGTLYLRLGLHEEAEPAYLEALEIRRATLGPDHALALATLSNLGRLYREWGRLQEAERHYRLAIAERVRAQGELHHDVDVDRLQLALVLDERGKRDEALALARGALQRLPESPADDSLVARVRRLLEVDGAQP